MKVQHAGTVRRHSAWPGELGKLAANPGAFSRHHATVAIGHAIAQEAALVNIEPVALGFHAYISSFRMRVEKEPMIRCNNHLIEALLFELMDSKADMLDRPLKCSQG